MEVNFRVFIRFIIILLKNNLDVFSLIKCIVGIYLYMMEISCGIKIRKGL